MLRYKRCRLVNYHYQYLFLYYKYQYHVSYVYAGLDAQLFCLLCFAFFLKSILLVGSVRPYNKYFDQTFITNYRKKVTIRYPDGIIVIKSILRIYVRSVRFCPRKRDTAILNCDVCDINILVQSLVFFKHQYCVQNFM